MQQRCEWPKTEKDIAYHDEEWGVPVHDDRRLFEFLILEGAQAGLSWSTICYAFMQATGMVNDHIVSCPRYRQIRDGRY